MRLFTLTTILSLLVTVVIDAQNVGIGTANPLYPLDVRTSNSGVVLGLRTVKDSIGASTLIRFTTAFNLFAVPDDKASFLGNTRSGAGSNLVFGTASNGEPAEEKMRLNFSGNLGLGTISPTGKLHIDLLESALSNAIIIDNNAQASNIQFQQEGVNKGFIQSTGDDFRIGTNSGNTDGILYLGSNGTNRVAVIGNGNVGIRTSSPLAPLHVLTGSNLDLTEANSGFMLLGNAGSTNMAFDNNEIQARNNGAASTMFLQFKGGGVRIGDGDFSTSLRLGVAGDAIVTGNLRVGEQPLPAGYTFGVDGKIICTEVMVRLVPSWPDYVFNPGYKLRNLYELDHFIKTNNHLPGIPKAAEVEKGLSLGEMQKLQMEKIEELTLYIIQLKKELDELRAVKK
jgi:hypothetical protein